ncbi:unnamed protein product, partial [Polarella glacialis]
MEVKTIDGFQGCEKRVILVSCVRCNSQGDLGFLADYRRLNVALTRAQYGLVVVGNRETLEKNPLWQGWLKFVDDHDLQVQRTRSANSIATELQGTVALSCATSSVGAASSSARLEGIEAVRWDEVAFKQDIWPLRAYAYCGEDVHLLSGFLELTPLQGIDPEAVKLNLRVLRFLRLCDYSVEDICTILAHASAYFLDAWEQCGNRMEAGEVGNVLACLLFVAHCYAQDETCPLSVWHKHLFRKYCPLKVLNSAVMRLMEIRGYLLRISDSDLSRRMCHLHSSIRRFGSIDPAALGRLGSEGSLPTPRNLGNGYGDKT